MSRKSYLPILAGAAVILALVLLLAVHLGRRGAAPREEGLDVAPGVSYLRSLEERDPEAVVATLKAQRQRHLEELREERLQQLESGKISVWPLFEDYVLLGDSRAVGFSFYDFLPENRVLALSGAKIWSIEEQLPEVRRLNPSTVFLCFGLNDVASETWSTPESYIKDYEMYIRQLQQALPEASIYVSSILPAHAPAFNIYPSLYDIPQYTAAVRVMCQTIDNCYYVDCDTLADAYSDLWEEDGIHFQRDFYPHWAAALITEVYSSQLDWEDDISDDATGDAYD